MERDDLPRSTADEEILASGDAVPPEILEPSAASIVAARRHAREDDAAEEAQEPNANHRERDHGH